MFQLWHKGKKHKVVAIGAKALGQLVWRRTVLPDAGAEQYAFETYGTPLYDFALGNGATFIRRPLLETQPAQWATFTAPILANPPLNTFQGQFVTQPLMNPNTALAYGVIQEGSVPADAYNAVAPASLGLSP